MRVATGGLLSQRVSLVSNWRLLKGRKCSGRWATSPSRQKARFQVSRTRCRVGNSQATGGSCKAREDTSGIMAKTAAVLRVELGRPRIGPNYEQNLCTAKNTDFEQIKSLFDISQSLILNHGSEICGMPTIKRHLTPWRRSILLHDRAIKPGHTTVELLREVQTRVTTRGIKPEEFKDRIIFMSMYNDIDWSKGGEFFNECFTNSLKVRDYAHRCPKGRGSFLGPGTEEKCYGAHTYKPEGKWNHPADVMMLNFADSGHPVFRATSALDRGL